MDTLIELFSTVAIVVGFVTIVTGTSLVLVIRAVRRQRYVEQAYRVRLAEYRSRVNEAAKSSRDPQPAVPAG